MAVSECLRPVLASLPCRLLCSFRAHVENACSTSETWLRNDAATSQISSMDPVSEVKSWNMALEICSGVHDLVWQMTLDKH